eukprot:10115255-Alexandrium_andersonii.AAC.1
MAAEEYVHCDFAGVDDPNLEVQAVPAGPSPSKPVLRANAPAFVPVLLNSPPTQPSWLPGETEFEHGLWQWRPSGG